MIDENIPPSPVSPSAKTLKSKEEKPVTSVKGDGKVKAVCIRPCVCQGSYRRIGDVLVFDHDKVNQHFKIID